jgi:hypothetical protein
MEYSKFASHMKYLAPNGVTLNVEERLQITMAIGTLQCEMNFEELHFWGKIEGKFKISNRRYI